jgi:hypothetical protein
VVIATGITEDGGREVLGVMAGDSETEVFWTQFLRSLRERGLQGVRLVLGDHHSGLVKAIRKVMIGAAYQRCRVHFLRNVFGVIPKDAAEMVAATIRAIFAQPGQDAVRHQLDTVADMLGQQFPQVRQMLLDAKDDLTAFAAFPERRWKKIQSTNPLERVNREIKRAVSTSSRSSPTTTHSSASSPPCSSRCTTSGSPSPAATYPKAVWTASTPPSPAKAPPRSPTPPTRPTIDRLHHKKGHDPSQQFASTWPGSRTTSPGDVRPSRTLTATLGFT